MTGSARNPTIRARRSRDDQAPQPPAPGDIVAYHRRPRHRGEILVHNHIVHHSAMSYGANGFRWFSCRAGGD